MAMLKYVKIGPHKSCNPSVLSQKHIKDAQKFIANTVSVTANKSQGHGKYSEGQCVMIGKYFAKDGPTCAAKHYSAVLEILISKFTAKRLK